MSHCSTHITAHMEAFTNDGKLSLSLKQTVYEPHAIFFFFFLPKLAFSWDIFTVTFDVEWKDLSDSLYDLNYTTNLQVQMEGHTITQWTNLADMVFDCRRKLEELQKTHADTERTVWYHADIRFNDCLLILFENVYCTYTKFIVMF